MQYNLRKAAKSGFFRSFLSGEGMVAEFTGPGEILIQTRNLAAFAGLLKPFFPSQGGGGGGGSVSEVRLSRPADGHFMEVLDPKRSSRERAERREIRLKARAMSRGVAIGR